MDHYSTYVHVYALYVTLLIVWVINGDLRSLLCPFVLPVYLLLEA